MQIASQHTEAQREPTRSGMEEGLLFDGIALNGTYVTVWCVQFAAAVESNLAYAREARPDRAAMSACKAAQPITVNDFIELGFPSVLGELFGNRLHRSTDSIISLAPRSHVWSLPLAIDLIAGRTEYTDS